MLRLTSALPSASELSQQTETFCVTDAMATLVVTGGTGSARARSNCQVSFLCCCPSRELESTEYGSEKSSKQATIAAAWYANGFAIDGGISIDHVVQPMLQAEGDARNGIAKIVEDWINGVQEDAASACTNVAANAVVEGVAEAVAKAFTTVANMVRMGFPF